MEQKTLSQQISEWTIIVLSLVLYCYATITGVGNLIGLNRIADSLGSSVSLLGWLLLAVRVLLPATVLFAVLLLTRKKRRVRWAAIFAGITFVAVILMQLNYLIGEGVYFNG